MLGPGGEDVTVHTMLTGDFNVANALGALAALGSIGVDVHTAAAGIAALPGVPGHWRFPVLPGWSPSNAPSSCRSG